MLKGKGGLSSSELFTYSVDKKAIVREIVDTINGGNDASFNPLFLPPHLRRWLAEEGISLEAFENLNEPKVKAITLPPHLRLTMAKARCNRCMDNTHLPDDCKVETPCQYCGCAGHNVMGCRVMHRLCTVCLRR